MRKIVDTLTSNTKRLFLIDGLGAFVTAASLLAFSSVLNEYIGLPKSVLIALSAIALAFCVYSISCFFFVAQAWRPFLKAIVVANVTYCVLTLGLVLYFYPQLTILGLTYFLLEIAVVGGLVYIEIYTLASGGRKGS